MLKLKNLKGYCDEGNIDRNKKTNKFGAPYHGRGDYYTYLPYLLGLALQLKKGYQIQSLALRNDNLIFQQMNFDMLINLPSVYENAPNKTMSQEKHKCLILGIAIHLAEDLWAHVAIINHGKRALEELNEDEGCFKNLGKLEELRYEQGKPICYLNMKPFCKRKTDKKDYYGITHARLAEGSGKRVQERKDCARDAAARLLGYFKNGYIMYSGSQKLSGKNQANQTDKQRLGVLKCAKSTISTGTYSYLKQAIDKKTKKPIYNKKTGKPVYDKKEMIYGRYVCSACENGQKDSCYLLYFNDKRKRDNKQITLRLGYAEMRKSNAK